MCLILLAYRVHPRYPLILAANRDEFYDRPAAAARLWQERPDLLAGRDLVHGGTWLGVTRQGLLAAVTNYRDPRSAVDDPRSRGELVPSFLTSEVSARDFLVRLRERGSAYNGFNLLLGDADGLYCFSNRTGTAQRIDPGVHGLSNHLLDTPWPKVVRGKELLGGMIAEEPALSVERLFDILADRRPAPDDLLPSTGVSLEWERLLSSIFISSSQYGTRASTVLLVDAKGRVTFVERTFVPGGEGHAGESRFVLERGRAPESTGSGRNDAAAAGDGGGAGS